MVSYPQPHWKDLPLEQRARNMARQGYSFLTSEAVRVVHQLPDGGAAPAALVDVPKDGRTIGEIVMRGNIAMKEVRRALLLHYRGGR